MEAAISFERGARIIYATDGHKTVDSVPALYLLIGFAFELAMKSILAADGVDENRLRSGKHGIGHDLQEAMCEMAKRNLMEGQHERLPEIIQQLQIPHKNYHFRYMPAEGDITVPWPELCFEVLGQMVTCACLKLGVLPDE